ncbi:reverse transcriptase/maturase family protein [uncultured Tyzzerella sp.]|uniref:reverse transcriptase/maturase family protein n=1 Tax=uncultured Tyzzerella sp. TaxID=2321398 RepID=UPI0029429998|nr:reverse transcriptase/maturase family protein [uncultured Tyzzerella sp.]
MNWIEWKKNNNTLSKYTHFDKRTSICKCFNYIINPDNISKHSFYPFIYYEQEIRKFSRKNYLKYKQGIKEKPKPKTRPICYSSHIDKCIYKYYSALLNLSYNSYSKENNIDNCVLAYITNKDKKNNNNIYFAKNAFDFIKKSDCNIIVGDFSNFFDNLEHNYLKKCIKEVLNVNTLSNDWYAIFKNITKYSYWRLEDLLELNNMKYNFNDIKEFNKLDIALSRSKFKALKKKYIIPNKKKYGIPQGSAISGVLSNVYMINFDKSINTYISSLNGLYLRYSDDFIIIFPKNNNINDVRSYINKQLETIPNLKLQEEKTQIYTFCNNTIKNCTNLYYINIKENSNKIDYLGFVFDGKKVTFRDKTISKYYTKMYRKLNHIIRCQGKSRLGKKISCRNLYIDYTQKGIKHVRNPKYPNSKGNFLTYVNRAKKIFGNDYLITTSTNRHLLKIRRKRQKFGI